MLSVASLGGWPGCGGLNRSGRNAFQPTAPTTGVRPARQIDPNRFERHANPRPFDPWVDPHIFLQPPRGPGWYRLRVRCIRARQKGYAIAVNPLHLAPNGNIASFERGGTQCFHPLTVAAPSFHANPLASLLGVAWCLGQVVRLSSNLGSGGFAAFSPRRCLTNRDILFRSLMAST
jgi:hypothetical protein